MSGFRDDAAAATDWIARYLEGVNLFVSRRAEQLVRPRGSK
jgi:hypothetical protein